MYDYTMARTNIDIDERLIGAVMRRYSLRTKREAVDFALRRLVGSPPAIEDILRLEGSGWDGDLGAMRTSQVPDEL